MSATEYVAVASDNSVALSFIKRFLFVFLSAHQRSRGVSRKIASCLSIRCTSKKPQPEHRYVSIIAIKLRQSFLRWSKETHVAGRTRPYYVAVPLQPTVDGVDMSTRTIREKHYPSVLHPHRIAVSILESVEIGVETCHFSAQNKLCLWGDTKNSLCIFLVFFMRPIRSRMYCQETKWQSHRNYG